MYIEQISKTDLFEFVNSLQKERIVADENLTQKYDLGDGFILQIGDASFLFSDFYCKRGKNNKFEDVKEFYGFMLDQFGDLYKKDYMEDNAKKAAQIFGDGVKIYNAKKAYQQEQAEDKQF